MPFILPLSRRALVRTHLQRLLGVLAFLGVLVVGGLTTKSHHAPVARAAFANPASYSPNSPHWSHIRISDFGRAVKYLPFGAARTTGYQWYAAHMDMTEVGMENFVYTFSNEPASYIKTFNPTMKTFGYDFDLSMCQHQVCSDANAVNTFQNALPEDYYLHFSESTTIEYRDLQDNLLTTATIPGCPEPQPLDANCRVSIYNWRDYRWIANLKNPSWRAWYADHLIAEMDQDRAGRSMDVDGLFLDEHGPGFSMQLSVGYQNVITSGGGIREYGGARPRNFRTTSAMDALDQEYANDVETWLSYLRGRLEPLGKFVHVNVAEYFMDPLGFDSAVAANGAMTELLHMPDHFRHGASMYQTFLNQVRQITVAGGSVDLAFTWCADLPTGFTAGTYHAPIDRYRMWNLASYYMAKEAPTETGTAYFNPNICIQLDNPDPLDFRDQWLRAYEQDVGLPIGEPTIAQHGSISCDAQGYSVFSRQFEHATVFVRPRDGKNCVDYSDTSAVTVPLNDTMQMLQPDGTLSANITSVSLRNAEAVILFPSQDTTPPAAVNDFRGI